MKTVHIVGRKNHGKTALIVDLVREFVRTGLRAGTIKHCGHEHELDVPGKDSHLHHEAGASSVLVLTPGRMAAYQPRSSEDDWRAQFDLIFQDCDIVLIEGWLEGPGAKVEVWRAAMGTPPIASEDNGLDIAGVATDDLVDLPVPVWSRSNIQALALRVLEAAQDI